MRGQVKETCGDGYSKPRPAVIVQADSFALTSLTLAPLTSDLGDAPLLRIPVKPDGRNGLQKASHVTIDKIVTVPRSKIRQRVGTLDRTDMQAIDTALDSFFGLALTAT